MSHTPLTNYLRTHRRRTGLSQTDVAALLGARSGALVSRHETGERRPILRTAIAYEIVLGISIRQIYAGIHTKLSNNVRIRATRMLVRLEACPRTVLRDLKIASIKRILEEEM
jgi:DNA-binding XRE family transcriptional regulator